MRPVTTDPKGEVRRQSSDNTPALAKQRLSKEFSWYVTGFVDGEGSFLVSFSQRSKLKTGLEVRPSFTISQHRRSLRVLEDIRDYFGCGGIRYNRHDQTYKYEVRSLSDLTGIILKHFKRYPLQTAKADDFKRFADICKMMKANLHRSREGAIDIIDIAYAMNHQGARRYEKEYLLKIIRKMKV